MKLTYSQISQELFPAFNQLIQAQGQGLVILPQKASFAFGKSLTAITKHVKAHTKLRNELIEEFVQKDENGNYKTIKVNNVTEYDFKEGAKPLFIEKSKELGETVVDCPLHAISRQELESINNFPIQLYPILEEFEMITELSLEKPKAMKILN